MSASVRVGLLLLEAESRVQTGMEVVGLMVYGGEIVEFISGCFYFLSELYCKVKSLGEQWGCNKFEKKSKIILETMNTNILDK